MEFGEKLQLLRKQRGLTQEELAQALYVSRTAVSKWESGRGYPNIDSLKAIAKYFSVTVDDLLSGGEALTIAEEESRQKEEGLRERIFGLLDISGVLLLFLPLFGEEAGTMVRAVSLLLLGAVAPYLRAAYFAFVIAMIVLGVWILALPLCSWAQRRKWISLTLSMLGVLLFIVSRQAYAAVFVFVFLLVKVFLLIKKP